MLELSCFNIRKFTAIFVIGFVVIIGRQVSAEPLVYRGTAVFSSDSLCNEKSGSFEIVLVFNGDISSPSSGWFYGKETSAAEFHQIAPMHFDVTYPFSSFNKLPSSYMELLPSEDGFRVLVRDYIPKDQKQREGMCFFEKLTADLHRVNEPVEKITQRAQEIFAAELLLLEAEGLLFNRDTINSAKVLGKKAEDSLVRLYGRLSEESLDAVLLIAKALAWQDRFDEAIEVIAPYLLAMPEDMDLKAFEWELQKHKMDQDAIFDYDPDSEVEIDAEPLV